MFIYPHDHLQIGLLEGGASFHAHADLHVECDDELRQCGWNCVYSFIHQEPFV